MTDDYLDLDAVLGMLDPPALTRDALCLEVASPALFFPERGDSTEPAKAVCARCLVRAECLAYALAEHIQHGIWGGTSERERRRLRSGRAA